MPSGTGPQGWHEWPAETHVRPVPGSAEDLLAVLRRALASGTATTELAAFKAGIERALHRIDERSNDRQWSLHDTALACDQASTALLEHGRLEAGVSVLRLGLTVRHRLSGSAVADELFRTTVDIPIEIAASHLAIANAFRRGGRPAEALAEIRAGIAAYRREIETGSDPYALDTLASHVEDAGNIARDIPDRGVMRAHFADSLALRERAARLAPEDCDLARAFIEACVWRAPDLGKASAAWLDRARRLLRERESEGRALPGTGRLHNLVDTAGAPYLSS